MMKWIIVALVGLNGYLVGTLDLSYMGRAAWAVATQATMERAVVPLGRRDSTSTAFVNVSFAGTEVTFRALVDTGASTVILPYEIFAKLSPQKIVSKERPRMYVMADGDAEKWDVYVVRDMVLGLHCRLADVEVAILPKEHEKPYALLGMNVMGGMLPFTMYTDKIVWYDWQKTCK